MPISARGAHSAGKKFGQLKVDVVLNIRGEEKGRPLPRVRGEEKRDQV